MQLLIKYELLANSLRTFKTCSEICSPFGRRIFGSREKIRSTLCQPKPFQIFQFPFKHAKKHTDSGCTSFMENELLNRIGAHSPIFFLKNSTRMDGKVAKNFCISDRLLKCNGRSFECKLFWKVYLSRVSHFSQNAEFLGEA